jgi:hypothetical protein
MINSPSGRRADLEGRPARVYRERIQARPKKVIKIILHGAVEYNIIMKQAKMKQGHALI